MVVKSVNGQKVTGQKVTKLLGQKVTIYIFYPGGQKVTTYIFVCRYDRKSQYVYTDACMHNFAMHCS